ncbi:MAG: PQQ-like beta-propeller repeat protein, partial [Planctomycetales bacterium]
MPKPLVPVLLTLCMLLVTAPMRAGDPLDWPNWRGPQQNGTYQGTGLADAWDPEDGTNVSWKRPDLAGRSTPIVMNGKLYTIVRSEPGTSREGEKVVCVDAATGKTIWERKFNVYLSDVPDTRVGWSCCVGDPETGYVYALGVCGYFQCLDGQTGELLWSHSLHEEYGLLSTYGGRTNVPVLFDDLVIVSAVVIGWGDMAKPAHRFLAFNKTTGELVWFNGTRLLPYDTTYSTPTVAVIGGQQSLVFGSGDGAVWALQPRTGKGIWKYQLSARGLNLSPLVVGDRIFTGHSEENIEGTAMGTFVGIDALADGGRTPSGEKDITDSATLWRHDILRIGKSSPVPVEDLVVAVDDGARLRAFNPDTGDIEIEKKLGRVMRSSPLYADGKIYLCTRGGVWYTLGVEDGDVEVIQKLRLPGGEECHGSVIAAQGRLYLPTTDYLYCIADPGKKSAPVAAKESRKEEPL